MHYRATKTKSKKERLISHAQFCTVFSELMALTMLRKVTEIFLGDASGMNNDVKLKKISLLLLFLGSAISSMGISAPPPVENSPMPTSQPSPHVYQEKVHVSINTLPEFDSVSCLCSLRHMLVVPVQLKRQSPVYQVITPKWDYRSVPGSGAPCINSDYFPPSLSYPHLSLWPRISRRCLQ